MALALLACTVHAADPLVYVGTYTGGGSKGIYAFRLQSKTGKLTPLGIAAETSNPSFLVKHPTGDFLYAVNENGNAGQMGSVSAFAIDPQSGKLKFLNWVSSRGGAPCHLAFDRAGRWLAVANCEGGSVSILPVLPDGKLGDAVWYSKPGSRATGVAFSPDNRFLLTVDSGLDRIFVYRFDETKGSISANPGGVVQVKSGSGIRHILFHPNGKALYAVNEAASTVTVFRWDAAEGKLTEAQTLPALPSLSSSNKAAEIALNNKGNLLYVSNRGHDSIFTFSIDPDRMTLAPAADYPTLGRTPRHFAIDPAGEYLLAANQDSDDVTVFKIDARTGQLIATGKLAKGISKPASVLFLN